MPKKSEVIKPLDKGCDSMERHLNIVLNALKKARADGVHVKVTGGRNKPYTIETTLLR
jgi:hypothetical protein